VWVEPKLFGEMYVVACCGKNGFCGFKIYAHHCLQVQWVL
jgi:hypothetical protein